MNANKDKIMNGFINKGHLYLLPDRLTKTGMRIKILKTDFPATACESQFHPTNETIISITMPSPDVVVSCNMSTSHVLYLVFMNSFLFIF